MTYTVDTGLLSREAIDWLDGRYRLYKRSEVSELAICGEMVQVYAGLQEAELRRVAREYFRKRVEANIFPEMLELVQTLQSRGTEIWAVSSTNDWVVEEGVTRFGIPANRVLCARVQSVDGVITDRLIDVPTDQGKVTALAGAGITAPDAVFGNSVHDAAMLAIARGAFPVNPSPALVERSSQEGWSVYYPASIRSSSLA